MQCNLCGKDSKLVRIEIEGAVVEVCEDCASFGKKVIQPEYRQVKRPLKLDLIEDKKEIVPNYGKLIASARNKKSLSREDLANAILEKESVIRRIEMEEMTPDDKLAEKIEKFLGIKLFEEYRERRRAREKRKTLELTLGDVVEVK